MEIFLRAALFVLHFLEADGELRGFAPCVMQKHIGSINQALGDSGRFLALLEEYQEAPQVSRVRLYLETMEKIGPKIKKCIIPPGLNKGLMKIYGIGE